MAVPSLLPLVAEPSAEPVVQLPPSPPLVLGGVRLLAAPVLKGAALAAPSPAVLVDEPPYSPPPSLAIQDLQRRPDRLQKLAVAAAPAPPLGGPVEAVVSAGSPSGAPAAKSTVVPAASLTAAIAASQSSTRPQFARVWSANRSAAPKICHGREGHRVSRRRVRLTSVPVLGEL